MSYTWRNYSEWHPVGNDALHWRLVGVFRKQDMLKSSNVMGGGGAIRDHTGRWLFDFSANFGIGSPILAKLLAMNQNLKLVGI
ncbi:hypothetical protein Lal_00013897 [Lupinus albus]|nr:hypothetical protein Lal_00013897 [Lupinus albus]